MEFDPPGQQKNPLPSGVAIVHHVAGRIRELKRLYNDIATTKSEMLVHQMLPNHMRRRAMSHNPKRLPLKYRQIHTNQMAKSGPNAKKRRPSRKYRRKSRNLMKEYARRKQQNIWLETHIWHAKRYHMRKLWNYMIPYAPTDKRYRASYKAAANHCLLQDISFFGSIEISGSLDHLRDKFKQITSQECGLTLMAKCFQNGSREGHVDLFKIDSYPLKALARVSFMWKSSDDTRKTLWLFVHPTAYREVLQEIIILFQLQNVNRNDDDSTDAKVVTRNKSLSRNPRYVNSGTGVEVVELKDTLNRFRLTGPYSHAVLLKALKPAMPVDKSWLGKLLDSDLNLQKAHSAQVQLWKDFETATSPSELPPHVIVGLNVVDPRTNRPAKREKIVNQLRVFDNDYIEVPSIASTSPIWNKELRDDVTKNMMTTSELCQLRNKNQLVPGVASSFESDLQSVPLLLVQRPGSQSPQSKRLGFGSGWDVIVPAGYGLSIWLSLIRCGTKSGGWREMDTIANEMGTELFAPDTVSGLKENNRQLKLKRDEYFRKPPNKRTNYNKMCIASPFAIPFHQLVQEWGGTGEYHVLRNKSQLDFVSEVLRGKMNIVNLKLDVGALIPISISMDMRGTPGDFGIICLPTKRDVKNWLVQKYQRDRTPIHIEPIAKDDVEKERKMLRNDHKKLLKRLRNRRVRAKRKIQATANYHVKIQKSSAEKIIEQQYEKMCELWLPQKSPTIRNQCSRSVFGYLSASRFTFCEGQISGVGYVTRDGFRDLMNVFEKFKGLQPFVLTRSTNSKCYHAAQMFVRMNL